MAYSDYTNYDPANTGYQLTDITTGGSLSWSPMAWATSVSRQTHITAQLQLGTNLCPFSMSANQLFSTYTTTLPPWYRNHAEQKMTKADMAAYKAQADEVIQTSATLTDYQKVGAELFDYKSRSADGPSSVALMHPDHR